MLNMGTSGDRAHQAELLAAVEASTAARQKAEWAASQSRAHQAQAIATAVSAGVLVADLVEATGLTRGRIYQIVDGQRGAG